MPSSPAQPRASSPASEYRIFAGITYHLASSLPPTRAEELAFVLDAHGGQAADKELGVKDPKLTTVVSNSVRFEGWEVVAARMEGQGGGEGGNGDGRVVEVVTDKWVERSIVLGRLQSGSHFSADPSLIFSGVVACASDLPAADLEVLSAGITALGGQWRTGLTKDVTHLFALNPGSAKYATAMHYREETGIKVVLPHWFDDAVRLGMGGLDTRPYEWPEPALLRGPPPPGGDGKEKAKGKEKDIPDVEKDDVKRNMYATAALFTLSMNRSSPPTEADISLVNNGVPGNVNGSVNGTPGPSSIKSGVQVWTGRKILLSRTLQLYGNRREAVQKGIERAGGIVLRFEGDEEEDENSSGDWNVKLSRQEKVRRRHEAERVDECDIFVTRWRWGKAYVQAVKTGKTIGTLAWLFHVQSTGILARPLDQLLHYPVPKRPIEGFSHHTITVTNYTGEAREYLKKLITAMGAHFTPSMSGQNTALIAAYINGTKANKALSWSIPVVNHTWLEDCFIQWRNLTVAREKYIVFPAGVDFSELLGERSLTAGASSGGGVANRVELEGEALEERDRGRGEEDSR
ncbi:hypothetical protein NLJ89_g4795 [Agrocybe chaxingu]|uniref:BRCT domain-containing protein n=1 Tax=Agrocybe chaxingu TaxID=84603 RepID=A0A9W8K284_9AGAR|nr:hypothetical protein NLJ89_g4795 [Agrocybe chaxingu]